MKLKKKDFKSTQNIHKIMEEISKEIEDYAKNGPESVYAESVEKTLERINLVDRSMKLWEDYMKGKLSKEKYKMLQDATLAEIRSLKDGKESESEG